MDVYWSTVYPMEVYADYHMLYKEPRPLIADLVPERGADNPHDFFACPAWHQHAKNTFVVPNALHANVAIRPDGFTPLDDRSKVSAQLFSYMTPTRKKYRTIMFDHRMLFFSERPVTMSSYPAFMHRAEAQRKLCYVPASYDISRWLRPLQGQYEVYEDVQSVRIAEDDPLYYVKFETKEKIRLRRFTMTEELQGIAHGCVHMKLFKPQQSLDKVYEAFESSKLPGRTLKLIKENLLE